ncbi:WD repeat-containing protein 74-like [Quercus lobata]|uniref:WD repeat-containing protein 74-like n=1 Tax=Quercus lobata TaxID=97700 RepID=UPI001244FC2A|nr:WD repeat-containing protein 74-like [Quercus lobata]
MPRTTTLECPGCPSLRALTFDALGLIKVIEAKGSQGGAPRVVERWGELDSSKCVLAASINDRKDDPLLAVARKTGMIEVLSAINGNICFTVSNANEGGPRPEDDAVVGLHLFAGQKLGLTSRSCTLLTCTTKGNTSMRSIEVTDSPAGSASIGSSNTWSVCSSGNILCSKVDGSEKYAIFGGKGVEMNMWDLNSCTKIWATKSPPKNSLDIFTPTWFTSSTFLSKDDHRKIVAGTNSHQVCLYDISAQRRPVISFDFRETPIKSVTEDLDGYTVYVGNGSGDLASFDMRSGKLLGCFLGKCSGSIRSIARHPKLPVIASCGLDSYLCFWDIKTRQLLSAVFLKQHLTNVVFDSNFADEEVKPSVAADLPLNAEQIANETEIRELEETLPVKRKKASKEEERRKKKKATKENEGNKEASKENNGSKKKVLKENEGSKKLKSKKSKRSTCEIHDES